MQPDKVARRSQCCCRRSWRITHAHWCNLCCCSIMPRSPSTRSLGCIAVLPAVVMYFAVVADVSIASLNLSLLVNSVGFYQVNCARRLQPGRRARQGTAMQLRAVDIAAAAEAELTELQRACHACAEIALLMHLAPPIVHAMSSCKQQRHNLLRRQHQWPQQQHGGSHNHLVQLLRLV